MELGRYIRVHEHRSKIKFSQTAPRPIMFMIRMMVRMRIICGFAAILRGADDGHGGTHGR